MRIVLEKIISLTPLSVVEEIGFSAIREDGDDECALSLAMVIFKVISNEPAMGNRWRLHSSGTGLVSSEFTAEKIEILCRRFKELWEKLGSYVGYYELPVARTGVSALETKPEGEGQEGEGDVEGS